MKLLALLVPAALCAQPYVLGPDSQVKPGVPKGNVAKYSWNTSAVFPGTTRDYWVYVPAQYDGSKPACVMIFQPWTRLASQAGRPQRQGREILLEHVCGLPGHHPRLLGLRAGAIRWLQEYFAT